MGIHHADQSNPPRGRMTMSASEGGAVTGFSRGSILWKMVIIEHDNYLNELRMVMT